MKASVAIDSTKVIGAAIACLSVLSITGCTPTLTGARIEAPSQSLEFARPAGKTRIVFFNDTNLLLWPASNKIVMALNDEVSPPLFSGEYLQVFVDAGGYVFRLRHWDVFTFTDEHQLTISGEQMYIKVFNKFTSTEFEIVEPPADFLDDFTPVELENDT
jgi:hypothetical protein